MRISCVPIGNFREISGTILDVRSPGEFARGHIPGAVNIPVFDDSERVEIGICYKKRGSDAAVELGFQIVGPKLGRIIRQVKKMLPEKTARIHCWRGGMRSQAMGWLLQTAGIRVRVLEGGYKSYRRWIRKMVGEPRKIIILRGLTGTGKTAILQSLSRLGEQVLDLEGMAKHRGSSFGGLGLPAQPTTQQFENHIAERLCGFDANLPVWIEAESRRIGACYIPEELFKQMKSAEKVEINRPISERVKILTEMYGAVEKKELFAATLRIEKKLGGKRTREALELIQKNKLSEACEIILDYYDRCYNYDFRRTLQITKKVSVSGLTDKEAAKLLLEKVARKRRPAVKTNYPV